MAPTALRRLRAFSWLAPDRLEELAGAMTLLRFERQQLIVPDKGMPAISTSYCPVRRAPVLSTAAENQ